MFGGVLHPEKKQPGGYHDYRLKTGGGKKGSTAIHGFS
jgi:hypothetical protein